MNDVKAPARLIWALGVTQIIGYGSLYYAFSILAPDMARDFSISEDHVFGNAVGVAAARRSDGSPQGG
jgi:hypothetical protein